MDTQAYVVFLIIGVILVVLDGQIIYRSGRRFLENSYGDPAASGAMTRLITVMFHFAVLGILGLISTIDMGGRTPTEAVVTRLGVVLILLAIAHGITLAILARLRDEQMAEEITARRADERQRGPATGADRAAQEPVVTPVPGQGGRDPRVAPGIEQNIPPQPYSS
ncbi:hypothetical protein [Amycolatopsis anabasis]|uniref:hypothetical protein n=1 Tax=Amycolatopsis anabasis TaxID=1840409 RepID=UPI00131BC5BA|nr:hypothetical protein [Amycolatopsis anabasis]